MRRLTILTASVLIMTATVRAQDPPRPLVDDIALNRPAPAPVSKPAPAQTVTAVAPIAHDDEWVLESRPATTLSWGPGPIHRGLARLGRRLATLDQHGHRFMIFGAPAPATTVRPIHPADCPCGTGTDPLPGPQVLTPPLPPAPVTIEAPPAPALPLARVPDGPGAPGEGQGPR